MRVLALAALTGVALAAAPAEARTFVSVGIGGPAYPAYGYYPGYYAPPPVVVYRPYYRYRPYGWYGRPYRPYGWYGRSGWHRW